MTYALHAFVSRPNADYKITSREYERIKMYGTYDKIKSFIEFNVFADGDLLEDFCINI